MTPTEEARFIARWNVGTEITAIGRPLGTVSVAKPIR
jgi:hypothetical protein